MTHVLIIADIEGIIGIKDLSNEEESAEIYTQEIELYIKALLENGVDKITVCDAHNRGNMINSRITKYSNGNDLSNIRLVAQTPSVCFNEKYDFAIMVGYHGMEGSSGILAHTFRYEFKRISVVDKKMGYNIPIGEVEIKTRWLGSHDIPVILVTGDREAVYEANCFNPYRQTCCCVSYFDDGVVGVDALYEKLAHNVKAALNLDWQLCLSHDDSEIEVEFYHPDTVDALSKIGYNKREDKVVFNSCADFMGSIFNLSEQLYQVDLENQEINIAFLKEIRKLAGSLGKEEFANSEAGALLGNGNLVTLDKATRDKVMMVIKSMVANVS